ncbi:hypothetical protein T09_15141 [Trichinella sp. T9]|nr:hypothetical protein T09_15141 [Trichinella sp. T9]
MADCMHEHLSTTSNRMVFLVRERTETMKITTNAINGYGGRKN